MSINNLRFTLRGATQDAHERLDTALVKHDLKTLPGLRAYLSVHYLARLHLQKLLSGYELLRDEKEKLASLVADFHAIGMAPPVWKDAPAVGSYHSLGLIYVLAGSSLGSKILCKSWRAASDTTVLNAGNFMTCAKESHIWDAFLTHIGITQYSQSEVVRIIDAANYCFGIFEAANNQVLESFEIG